jgi:hypothetical protein
MKVVITQMKAPWPGGAKPGDVVDLQGRDAIPGWAAGKCRPAEADAEATHVVEAPAPLITSEEAKAAEAQVDADGDDEAAAALAAANVQAAEEQAEADRLAVLKTEADALGMKVDRRWGADRLAAEIAEHKAKA